MKKYKFNSHYGEKYVEVMTWDEFIAYGLENDPQVKSHNSRMPWSFNIKGFPITHENDQKYLVYSMLSPNGGFNNFTPEHVLFITEWGLFPIQKSSFEWLKPEEISDIKFNKIDLVEARQWTNNPGNYTNIMKWVGREKFEDEFGITEGLPRAYSASQLLWKAATSFTLQVREKECWVLAQLNDWIAKDKDDNLHVFKNKDFQENYLSAFERDKGTTEILFIEGING